MERPAWQLDAFPQANFLCCSIYGVVVGMRVEGRTFMAI